MKVSVIGLFAFFDDQIDALKMSDCLYNVVPL